MSSRLTAMDVTNQRFSRKLRGHDANEVNLFLQSVAEEIERLHLENGEMREDLGRVREELDGLRSREQTLQETLISAQSMSTQMKEQAGREGELLISEARLRADKLLRAAQDRLLQLEADISRSKMEREMFEHRLRSVIDQHMAMLDLRREARGELDNLRVMPNRASTDAG